MKHILGLTKIIQNLKEKHTKTLPSKVYSFRDFEVPKSAVRYAKMENRLPPLWGPSDFEVQKCYKVCKIVKTIDRGSRTYGFRGEKLL